MVGRKGNSDLVDLEVAIHASTDKSFLVSLDDERKNAVWVPASLVEMERKPAPRERFATMTIPEWKAIETGLV